MTLSTSQAYTPGTTRSVRQHMTAFMPLSPTHYIGKSNMPGVRYDDLIHDRDNKTEARFLALLHKYGFAFVVCPLFLSLNRERMSHITVRKTRRPPSSRRRRLCQSCSRSTTPSGAASGRPRSSTTPTSTVWLQSLIIPHENDVYDVRHRLHFTQA